MSILNYPASVGHDMEVNPGWIEFSVFERKSPSNSTPKKTINLYLPESMRNPNTVSWGNTELGFLGGTLAGKGGGMYEGGKLAVTNFLTGLGSAAMRTAGSNVNSDTLLGVVAGKVKNPYLSVLFKGVNFRTFEMIFKFSPNSEKDCKVIDDIIKTFRGSSLPPGKSSDNSAFLGYPDEFEIRYIWKGDENKYLHKFKRCVLIGINTDYTSVGQWAVMRNGFPASITLSLTFSELDIVLRGDVEAGY